LRKIVVQGNFSEWLFGVEFRVELRVELRIVLGVIEGEQII